MRKILSMRGFLSLLVVVFVVVSLFSIPLQVLGVESHEYLKHLFKVESTQDFLEELFSYPALLGLSFKEGSFYSYDSMIGFYTKDYSLELSPFFITPDKLHVLIHFKDEEMEWAEILSWEEGFRSVPIEGSISLKNYLSLEVLSLDEETLGIGIQGTTGAFSGRMGEYTIYRYKGGQGYEKVWWTASPSVIIKGGSPLEILLISYREWDEGFPFYDLSHYSQISLGLFSRKWGVVYQWEEEEGTFIYREEREIFEGFSVVNHLLKALKEGDRERASLFVTEELQGRMDTPLSSLTGSFYLYPTIHEWAEPIGYEGDGTLINLLVSREKQRGETLWEELELEGVLLFLLKESEPVVKDIYYHRFCRD